MCFFKKGDFFFPNLTKPYSSFFQSMANRDKVLKFETFLNEKLRPDLKACLEQRDKIYEESAEYLSLKNSIEAIKLADLDQGQPLETKVDLGCNFYAKAKVKNPQKVFVDIGLGFYLELSHDEALTFIEKKTKLLDKKASNLTEESSKIKANIKVVLHGLRELQGTCLLCIFKKI